MPTKTYYSPTGGAHKIDPDKFGKDRLAYQLKAGLLFTSKSAAEAEAAGEVPDDADDQVDLAKLKVGDLRELAAYQEIDGAADMTKAALIEALTSKD